MSTEPVTDPMTDIAAERGQYLTFTLASQTYALDVLDVREIRSWSPPTPLPHATPEVLGAMNLRGAIIPVIDLRTALDVGQPSYDNTTGVVVVQAEVNARSRQMGLVVDRVLNVTRLEHIGDTDSGDSEITTIAGRFVLGLRRCDRDLVILIDLHAVMAASLEEETEGLDEPR